MKAVILEPRSSWSLALRSDTLWGLLLVAIRHVHGEQTAADVARAALAGTPPMVVSSAMEYVCQPAQHSERAPLAERTLLLPTPLLPLGSKPETTIADEEKRKQKQRQLLLPLEQWQRLLRGETFHAEPIEHAAHFATADILHIAMDRMRMHALDRITETGQTRGQLFLTTETFALNAGLWFLADGDMTLIEPALRYLDHVGFGTDSSVGKGHFAVSIEDFELPPVDTPTHMVTLSLYRPTSQEVAAYQENPARLWYELEFRQGKRSPHFGPAGTYQKQRLAFFREGSVFPYRQQPFYGSAVVVARADDHDVIHAGFALMIPARFRQLAAEGT